MPSAICLQRYAFSDMPSAICLQRYAFSDMPSAICLQRYAFSDMPSVICLQRYAFSDMPSVIYDYMSSVHNSVRPVCFVLRRPSPRLNHCCQRTPSKSLLLTRSFSSILPTPDTLVAQRGYGRGRSYTLDGSKFLIPYTRHFLPTFDSPHNVIPC